MLCKIVVFLLGMCLAVQVTAAFYRIIDLWSLIRSQYLRVMGGIALWSGISILLAFLLGPGLRAAFLWGMAIYLPFYAGHLYLLGAYVRCRYKCQEQRDEEIC